MTKMVILTDAEGNQVKVPAGMDGKTPVSPNNPPAKSQNLPYDLPEAIAEAPTEEPASPEDHGDKGIPEPTEAPKTTKKRTSRKGGK